MSANRSGASAQTGAGRECAACATQLQQVQLDQLDNCDFYSELEEQGRMDQEEKERRNNYAD